MKTCSLSKHAFVNLNTFCEHERMFQGERNEERERERTGNEGEKSVKKQTWESYRERERENEEEAQEFQARKCASGPSRIVLVTKVSRIHV